MDDFEDQEKAGKRNQEFFYRITSEKRIRGLAEDLLQIVVHATTAHDRQVAAIEMQVFPFDIDEEWNQAGIIATIRTVIPPENEHSSLREFGHIVSQGNVGIVGQSQKS